MTKNTSPQYHVLSMLPVYLYLSSRQTEAILAPSGKKLHYMLVLMSDSSTKTRKPAIILISFSGKVQVSIAFLMLNLLQGYVISVTVLNENVSVAIEIGPEKLFLICFMLRVSVGFDNFV